MEELIAKKYIKAVKTTLDNTSLKNVGDIFSILAKSFDDSKFMNIMDNPNISKNQKASILLDAVKSVKSKKIDNLIKLLVEHNRINIIPAIAKEIKKDLSISNKVYNGFIYSKTTITKKIVQDLSKGLGKKFDSSISLKYIKNDFNGIKVNVEDLGVEINFSKDRINTQMIEHIIKAI